MTPRVFTMDSHERVCATRAGLGLPAPDAHAVAPTTDASVTEKMVVFSEALRAALWALTDAGAAPVHSLRVLILARRLAEPALSLGGDGDEDGGANSDHGEGTERRHTLRMVLDDLATTEEVASLPRGYWLPAPLRIVPLHHVNQSLLIGGVPTRLLPIGLRSAVRHVRSSRILPGAAQDQRFGLPLQSEARWLRVPHDEIVAWAQGALTDTRVEPAGLELADRTVEVYRPERAHPDASQYGRWYRMGAGGGPLSGRFLGRTLTRAGWRYLVVTLEGGQLRTAGTLPSESLDVRRLLYGLDAEARRPTRIRRIARGGSVGYDIRSELPAAERRLLLALGGQLATPANGDYYPRCWTVQPALAPQVDRALLALGVRLDQQ